MMSVRKRTRARWDEYENRTGHSLPLNLVAKIGWISGASMLAFEMVTDGTVEEGILPAAIMAGGVILDKLTGGLGEPYPKKRVDQTEVN